MKKAIIIVSILLGACLLYLVGEQMFLFYKNDQQNLKFLLRNYSQRESINLVMLMDEEAIYDTCVIKNLPFAYSGEMNVSIGKHSMKIMKDDEVLYTGNIRTVLNRYIVIEYNENNTVSIWSSPRPIRDL